VLVALLAVAGAIVLVVRLPGRAGEMADKAAAQPLAVRASPAPVSPSARPSRGSKTPQARHHRRPRPSMTAATAAPPPAPSPSATAAPAGTAPPPAGSSTAAGQVLALINQARAQAGLPAYMISSGLDTSAGRHNAVMAGGLRPVTPVPGRAGPGRPGDRGRGGLDSGRGEYRRGRPGGDTGAAIAQMAVGLTQSMLGEKPPTMATA
jgi:hypothetical protein